MATDEPGRSSGLCRRPKEDRGKATKWLDGVTAAFVNYEEHKRNHREKLKRISHMALSKNQSNDTKKRICQITGATWMHPCNVLEWIKNHWKKMSCG